MKTKKVLIVAAIILSVFLALFTLYKLFLFKPAACSEEVYLRCVEDSGIPKLRISCVSDEDCSSAPSSKAIQFCYPSIPAFTECIGEKDFCGEDGFCKQCVCE